MEIRFISSLTAEDEDAFAPAVLKAVSAILDQLPIAYTVRIETTGTQVFQHTRVSPEHDRGVVEGIEEASLSPGLLSFGFNGRHTRGS